MTQAARDLASGADLARALRDILVACSFQAVFWETPPTTRTSRDRPFEFVLQDAPALARLRADPSPFRSQLRATMNTFENLGRDAVLVAPGPTGDFAHLTGFCRTAPWALQQDLWRGVGRALEAWWGRTPQPVWVSTSGLGVAWLHIRLDARPKYYTHRPYRNAGPLSWVGTR